MPLSVYIDNNVWDFIFDRGMDLSVELPRPDFCLCMTREAEFEIPGMPLRLRMFVEATVKKCVIETDSFFGLADPSLPPDQQRVGGLDEGRWIMPEKTAFIQQQRTKITDRLKRSGLYHNEADVSLGARAMHSIVLTLDSTGPIKAALQQGGLVVALKDFDRQGKCLRDFVEQKLAQRP